MPASLQTVRTILFDVGNTLTYVDTEPIGRVARELGLPVPAEELRRAEPIARAAMYGHADGDPTARDVDRWGIFLTTLLEHVGIDGERIATTRARLSEQFPVSDLWRRVEPGTHEVLATLRERGYPLGVVSNSDGGVSELLEVVRLSGYFDAVVDSHRVGVEKPEPRIFQIALEEMGRDAAHGVYVGDFYAVDVVGARNAGLEPILLDPLELAGSVDCHVIRRLDELLTLLPPRAAS